MHEKLKFFFQSILEPKEFISSKMPYADKRYDQKQHNPPPNELGFLGGISSRRIGISRSKAHIQRPSANQILFKMRTANRVLVSFTEDLTQTHSLNKNQLKSPKPTRKPLKDELQQLVSQVQIADNVIKTKRKQASSTTSETDDLKSVEASPVTTTTTAARKKSSFFTLGAVKKISIMTALKGESKVTPEEQQQQQQQHSPTFREWAHAEREKRFQALQQVSYQQIKQEREANEIFPKIKRAPRKFFERKEKQQMPGAEHLGGYLYGGFTKHGGDNNDDDGENGGDPTMQNETKFHVPLSMFSRAEVESKVRAIYRKKIQSARLDYMRIPQIPSDSDDDPDDVLEDIKGLYLVRTPYFRIPAITTQKKKRSERIKSKFLQGNRLKRINALLFDRKESAERNKQKYAVDEGYISPELLLKGKNFDENGEEMSIDFDATSPVVLVENVDADGGGDEDGKKEVRIFSSDYR